MLRSILAPALDTSTVTSTFCANAKEAVKIIMIRAKLTKRTGMISESFQSQSLSPFIERAIAKVLEQSLSERDARSATRGLSPVIRNRGTESLSLHSV